MDKPKEMTAQERRKIKRQDMPMQSPKESGRNFQEVATGFPEEAALTEAARCIQCKNPKCIDGCPVQVPIPQFIKALRERNLSESARILKSTNNLPAVCGRVCPQETQCEQECVLGVKGEPVAIGRLERYVADWQLQNEKSVVEKAAPTGKRVAIIGSGPAGLTCAADLAKLGHSVTLFEALHVAGGVLMYGIPEFRLPKAIVQAEIDYVKALGVEILLDQVVGKIYTLDELLGEQKFDAVFLGTGAGLPTFLKIPGENSKGVFSANEFLTRVNLMKGYLFPEWDTPVSVGRKVVVFGAGNVAMDAARCALRIGNIMSEKNGTPPPKVHIVYRRSREEMPARAEEIHHAEEEGIELNLLTTPLEILADGYNNARAVKCLQNKLGEPDASGRRSPVPIPGSEFEIEADTVIVAIGTSPNPLVFHEAEGLERSKWGTVVADEQIGKTKKDRVWAGGDIVTGAATVISAMGAGKRAAADIDAFLKK